MIQCSMMRIRCGKVRYFTVWYDTDSFIVSTLTLMYLQAVHLRKFTHTGQTYS